MPRSVLTLAAALVLGLSPAASTAAAAADTSGPATAEREGAGAAALERTTVIARGDFTTDLDYSTRTEREIDGAKCELTLDGALSFTGTLSGEAVGTTTALVLAPCTEATSAPPGTFFDSFRFEGTFDGRVAGTEVTGDLDYIGRTRPGGAINATVLLHTPLHPTYGVALLRADGEVGGPGSYRGVARVG